MTYPFPRNGIDHTVIQSVVDLSSSSNLYAPALKKKPRPKELGPKPELFYPFSGYIKDRSGQAAVFDIQAAPKLELFPIMIGPIVCYHVSTSWQYNESRKL